MFLKSISNKLKAIYLIWAFINVVLLAYGYGKRPSVYRGGKEWDIEHFYPFATGQFYYNFLDSRALGTYDYTEFLIYILTPLLIAYCLYLFKKK